MALARARFPDSVAIELFDALHKQDPTLIPNIPRERRLKYEAIWHSSLGQDDLAIHKYREIYNTANVSVPLKYAALAGLVNCYISQERIDESLPLIVDAHLTQPELLLGIPLDKLLSAMRSGDSETREPLLSALLVQIGTGSRSSPRDTEHLSILVDNFLSQHGITRPSQVLGLLAQFSIERLVFFLRFVCTLDVLDHSIEYENMSDLTNERVAICQVLVELDTANASSYSEEIFRLAQEELVQKALRHLDASRVGVNVRGIKDSLDESFRDRYERYSNFSGLTEGLRKGLRLQGISLAKELIFFTDASQVQFVELFNELKKRFLYSNEYGLDSYLSVRIRHGTLSGQIRSQFEREQLITRKSAADGVYDRNAFWSQRVFSSFGPQVEEPALRRLQAFSKKADEIIETVKDRWIQIKGDPNHNEGLFDYDYSEQELRKLWILSLEPPNYDQFIDFLFDKLWSRTEKNLEIIVDKIRNNLKHQLTKALDALAADIFAIDERIRHSQFNDSVNRCRTEIQNELEAIAAWFRVPNADSMNDFTAKLLVETAVATVKKCAPAFGLNPAIEVDDTILFKGGALVALRDIMFILLENVTRHGASSRSECVVAIRLNQDLLTISVGNKLSAGVDLVGLQTRVLPLQDKQHTGSSMSVTRKEGGSGYHKLHKLLRYDLERGENYSVEIEIGVSGWFETRVKMDRTKIVA